MKGKSADKIVSIRRKKQYNKNYDVVILTVRIEPIDIKYGNAWATPSYKEIKKIIDLFVEIHGKSEVEKELNIKIKSEKREHGER